MNGGAPAGTPTPSRVVLLGAVCAVLAGAVRLWTLRDLEAADPLFRVTILDEAVYVREALRIHEGRPATSASLVSMLWPWLLALFGAVTRHAASLVNVGLGSAIAGIAAAGAARLGGSLAAGAVAGGICALSGALVFQDATAQIETLLALSVLASVLASAAAARSPTWMRLALAGAAAGIAILGRGTHAGLLLGTIPALRGAGPRTGALRALVLAIAAAAPIVAFDQAVGAVPTSAGVNVWLGNNLWSRTTRSFGTGEIAMDPDGEARDVVRVATEAEGGRPLSTAEINAWWMRRAWREMSADWGAAFGHFAAKAALVFYVPDMGGNHDADVERQFAAWLRVAPVSVAWILVLGAAGWVVARRGAPGVDAAALAVVGGIAALIVVFPLTRYRMPLVPAAAVLVGVGVAAVVARRVDRGPRIAAGIVVVSLAAVAVVASSLRPAAKPEAWTNLGLAAMDTGVGDPDAYLVRALAEDPSYPIPALILGNRALERGDAREAIRRFDAAAAAAGGRPRWAGIVRDAELGRAKALALLGR